MWSGSSWESSLTCILSANWMADIIFKKKSNSVIFQHNMSRNKNRGWYEFNEGLLGHLLFLWVFCVCFIVFVLFVSGICTFSLKVLHSWAVSSRTLSCPCATLRSRVQRCHTVVMERLMVALLASLPTSSSWAACSSNPLSFSWKPLTRDTRDYNICIWLTTVTPHLMHHVKQRELFVPDGCRACLQPPDLWLLLQ